MEDSDSDADADLDAEEENPYGNVKLEGMIYARTLFRSNAFTTELLRPLTHPAELATHPTLSQAYLDPALSEMVYKTDAKIREERNNLWRAKNLYRYFTGDETWIPCERVEATEDWELFEPNPGFSGRLPSGESPGKKRRLNGSSASISDLDVDVQVVDALDPGYRQAHEAVMNGTLDALQRRDQPEAGLEDGKAGEDGVNGDISMIDQDQPLTNGLHDAEKSSKMEDNDETAVPGRPSDPIQETIVNGNNQRSSPAAPPPETDGMEADMDEDDRPSTASTPPPLPRRITRALAAEAETNSNPQIASPPPTSPTISSNPQSPSSQAFQPHPMFLLPPQLSALHTVHPSHQPLTFGLAHSGLPPEELLETRKLLNLYIQKSEETLRGLEGILGKLIKAKRRRDQVWEWCIAEGHVGEMSDGEDWIDVDRWGMSRSELRKGRDEDSGAATGENGAVAVAAEGDVDAQGAVVMGGRKGKRRRNAAKD